MKISILILLNWKRLCNMNANVIEDQHDTKFACWMLSSSSILNEVVEESIEALHYCKIDVKSCLNFLRARFSPLVNLSKCFQLFFGIRRSQTWPKWYSICWNTIMSALHFGDFYCNKNNTYYCPWGTVCYSFHTIFSALNSDKL